MQQTAVHNGSGAAQSAQAAQATRGSARAVAGSNAGAGPAAGFAALLATLGQDEADAELLQLPGSALGAGADESAAGFLAATALPGQEADRMARSQTDEWDDPVTCDSQTLAMLLAGLGQPAPAAPMSEPGQELPAADAATDPWSRTAQPGLSTLPAALDGGLAGRVLQPSTDQSINQTTGLGAGGHWASTSLVAETSRLDSGRQNMAPEQAEADAPRPALVRASRSGAFASRLLPGAAETASRLPGRGVQTGPAAAPAAVPGSAPSQGAPGSLAAAGPRLDSGPERSPELSARVGSTGGALDTALAGAAIGPAAVDGQRSGRGDAGQPGGQASHGSAPVAGAAEPEAAGPDAVADAAWQADLDAAQAELAENVTYWVHQQTQNAALTLEGDGQAVQVQVALTGDQAHITFRSDEEQARQLLDAGTQELRELLDAQGLQLAGVSIGMASSGGAGSRQPGQPPERGAHTARQGVVRVPGGNDGAAPAAGRRTGGISERSVDIFV